MRDQYFIYDGISSKDMGIQMQGPIKIGAAQKKVTKISVPGRSGDLVISEESYENRQAEARCFILERGAVRYVDALSKWLVFDSSYRRFEMSEDTEHFYLAMLTEFPEIDIRRKVLIPFTLEFDCKPQRFFKQGEVLLTLTEAGNIYNPSPFPAEPIITVYGSGSATLNVNGYVAKLNDIDGHITLDSETQNAYKGTLNKNGTVSIPEFPKLGEGANSISWTGGITSVVVTPRWWTI